MALISYKNCWTTTVMFIEKTGCFYIDWNDWSLLKRMDVVGTNGSCRCWNDRPSLKRLAVVEPTDRCWKDSSLSLLKRLGVVGKTGRCWPEWSFLKRMVVVVVGTAGSCWNDWPWSKNTGFSARFARRLSSTLPRRSCACTSAWPRLASWRGSQAWVRRTSPRPTTGEQALRSRVYAAAYFVDRIVDPNPVALNPDP